MKNLFLFVAMVCTGTLLFAQDEAKPQKLFGGGNFGLSFGRYTVINLSPQIGYRFNRFAAAGLGLNLQYAGAKERDLYGNDYSKTTQWITGLNLFGRFYPAQQFFLQVQPEVNYVFGSIHFYQPPEQTTKLDAEIVPCFFVGGGYAVPAGNGVFVTTVLYDLLQRPNSPYGNRPLFNVGYNFTF